MQITIEAGRLVCRVVREACERVRFVYGEHAIRWLESRGVFARTFVIVGQEPAVKEVVRLLRNAGFGGEIGQD